MSVTDHLIALVHLPKDQLPVRALAMAHLSLLDWMVCGRAGRSEPVAQKLHNLALSEGGTSDASLFSGGQVPARMAALVNGATSHALDYDDTHFAHVGHLSVGIYPAALAVAEELDASANDVTTAFLIGAEGAIRTGLQLGAGHYNLGFHQTATAGAFGATVAAARLLRLDKAQMRHALGLCATRAAGLRSQFGTMGKPYNAGIAAATGVEVAKLAQLGLTSADDGLMGAQGFVATHAGSGALDVPETDQFLFEDNKYKLHACCHGTHAMLEAVQGNKALKGCGCNHVKTLHIRTNPRWLSVCDLKAPRSGLEVKFSYAWLAGMALRGDLTGNDRTYTDALAKDAVLAHFAQRVVVIGDDSLSDAQVQINLTMKDGQLLELRHDLDQPLPDDVLRLRLQAKAQAVLGGEGVRLWQRFDDLSGHSARDLGKALRDGC